MLVGFGRGVDDGLGAGPGEGGLHTVGSAEGDGVATAAARGSAASGEKPVAPTLGARHVKNVATSANADNERINLFFEATDFIEHESYRLATAADLPKRTLSLPGIHRAASKSWAGSADIRTVGNLQGGSHLTSWMCWGVRVRFF